MCVRARVCVCVGGGGSNCKHHTTVAAAAANHTSNGGLDATIFSLKRLIKNHNTVSEQTGDDGKIFYNTLITKEDGFVASLSRCFNKAIFICNMTCSHILWSLSECQHLQKSDVMMLSRREAAVLSAKNGWTQC